MFVETLDGDLIPVNRIEKICEAQSQGRLRRWNLQLTGGEDAMIGVSAKTDLDNMPLASFPAAPGTKVLRVDDGQIFSYPVIGWVIPKSGNALPVTTDGINDGADGDEYLPVLFPDGMVYKPEEPAYSLEEFRRLHQVVDAVITLDPETVPGMAHFIEAVPSS